MAIEPLGSVMSVQAQSQVQSKPAVSPVKTAAEYTEVSARETASQVDNTISVVTNTREKGNPDGSADREGGK